jgi:hypothetical protein
MSDCADLPIRRKPPRARCESRVWIENVPFLDGYVISESCPRGGASVQVWTSGATHVAGLCRCADECPESLHPRRSLTAFLGNLLRHRHEPPEERELGRVFHALRAPSTRAPAPTENLSRLFNLSRPAYCRNKFHGAGSDCPSCIAAPRREVLWLVTRRERCDQGSVSSCATD